MAEAPARGVRESDGPAATEALGAELAGVLKPGDLVLVSGELGSGKTTFVRGACRALGVQEPITSPTFTIGRRYAGVAHVDLYRLDSLAGEDPGLLADYAGPDLVTFVEWPERAGAESPAAAWRVRLEHLGGDRRKVTIE